MKKYYLKECLPVLIVCILSANTMAQSYTWKNVKIGAGGFVSRLVFNPSQSNLLYARTDIGGAALSGVIYYRVRKVDTDSRLT